ncbi:MAG: SDR family oxidoreductase [Candidatus Magasanikbacteria bacterium]|nr:SDR family oxidoreductase [Candidatus Magasanikbacteria bacterium]
MILSGKIALITGATGTIGGEIARHFAREGARLVLSGRSEEQLKKRQHELSGLTSVEIFPADVADAKAVQECLAFVEKKCGQLDVLVCAAGTLGEVGTLEQCDPDSWLTAFKVNVLGTMMAIKYALPLLKKSPCGKIITFAGAGEGAFPRFSSYASSKGAIVRFTETVAAELQPLGITVNAISPGAVASGLREEIIAAGAARAGAEKYAAAQGAGSEQPVPPNKAAALAVWLASEKSSGLTGKNISAVWDRYEDIPNHLSEIMKSDIYNWRRIKPKDRGYDW